MVKNIMMLFRTWIRLILLIIILDVLIWSSVFIGSL